MQNIPLGGKSPSGMYLGVSESSEVELGTVGPWIARRNKWKFLQCNEVWKIQTTEQLIHLKQEVYLL